MQKTNTFKIILFFLAIVLFLLIVTACKTKTSTTTVNTTTVVTTTEYKDPIKDFYFGWDRVIEYVFTKQNDEIHWAVKVKDSKTEKIKVYSGIGIELAEANYAWKDESGTHLQLTFDAYKYVIDNIK